MKECPPVLAAVFRSIGIGVPVCEYRFDPDRKWRFDYAWPDNKLALEMEGGVWTKGRHTRGSGFMGDMEKYNRAAVLGWRLLRCTPAQLENGAVDLLADLAEAMTWMTVSGVTEC